MLWVILASFFALVRFASETALVRYQDRDPLLAFSYLSSQFLPLAVAGHTSRFWGLHENQTH